MPFMSVGWLAPAGQLYSTIEDLAKLGMMFAQPDKQKLLKPATVEPRFNEVAGDRPNLFVKWRVRY